MKALGYGQTVVTSISVAGTSSIKYTTRTGSSVKEDNLVDLSGLKVSDAVNADNLGNLGPNAYAKTSDLNNYTCSSISTIEGMLPVFSVNGVDASYTRGSSAYIQHATLESKKAYPIGLGLFIHGEDTLIISYHNHTLGSSGNYTYTSECLIISYTNNNDLSGNRITGLRITDKSFKAFEQN